MCYNFPRIHRASPTQDGSSQLSVEVVSHLGWESSLRNAKLSAPQQIVQHTSFMPTPYCTSPHSMQGGCAFLPRVQMPGLQGRRDYVSAGAARGVPYDLRPTRARQTLHAICTDGVELRRTKNADRTLFVMLFILGDKDVNNMIVLLHRLCSYSCLDCRYGMITS
ncbi:hypothetical protein CALCODRAFT_155759 [Calocera cornea HHB12733]|uniref:Uncharacterized protein n=1 Tax=Calocera cornea HHB12733 TaxID=1353952 RepID=A0A165HYZ1_9BASI|nr:hypothetical protein CALCODRAFT_155759 [Calocera cornea HHB12733]